MSPSLDPRGLRALHEVLAAHVDADALPGVAALVAAGDDVHVEVIGSSRFGGPPLARYAIWDWRYQLAVKYVLGRGLGENARAALIARGLAEVTRLALAKGGRAETLMGLAGIGDLILTCTSLKSRNTSLGFALGQGKSLAEILSARRSIAGSRAPPHRSSRRARRP